jgi:hypothetical protein
MLRWRWTELDLGDACLYIDSRRKRRRWSWWLAGVVAKKSGGSVARKMA